MKPALSVIEILTRYDLRKVIPDEIRARIYLSRKRVYKKIMETKKSEKRVLNINGSRGTRSIRVLFAAASIIVIGGLGFYFLRSSGFQNGAGGKQDIAGASVVFVVGEVSIQHNGASRSLLPGDSVESADVITTKAKSFAVVQFNELGTLRIKENSVCSIEASNKDKRTQISLSSGSVFSKVDKLMKDESYQVKTFNSLASVRGTSFLVSANTVKADVQVLEGKVQVSSDDSQADVDAERGVEVNKEGALNEYPISKKETLDLQKDSLYTYIPDVKEKSTEELQTILSDLLEKEKEFDAQIESIDKSERSAIPPLDRLRAAGKPLSMLSLKDGSQIAGSVKSQSNGVLILDTGEGLISIPSKDVVRRLPMK